jgi:hypothetical protein
LPNSSRTAAASALTGFQSAIARSQAGIPPVGTNTLDSIVTGNTRIDACPAACSLPSTSPTYMPIQVAANWNASSRANAAIASPAPWRIRQPTASPQAAIRTKLITP